MTGKLSYSEVEIKVYKLFSHTDRIGRSGGGVAFHVKDTLQCYKNTDIRKKDNSLESLSVQIIKRKEKFFK